MFKHSKFILLIMAASCLLVLTSCTDQPVVVNNYYVTNSDGSVTQTDTPPEGYAVVSSSPINSNASKSDSTSSATFEFGTDNTLKLNTTYLVTGTKNYLALRNAPYYDGANEIAKLSNGDTVEVLSQTIYGDKGEYCYVSVTSGKAKGQKGYVNRNYLSLKIDNSASSASSKTDKTTSSTTSKKSEPSVTSKKTENQSKAPSNQKVDSVSLTVKYNTNNTTYAIVEGKSNSGDVVWNYKTSEYPAAQLECASEIGQKDGIYYFVDGGTIVAANVQSGNIIWRNSDFGGASVKSTFAADGIYMCGGLHPDLFVVDYNGNTILKIKTISSDYYWPSDISVDGDIIAITMTGSKDGLTIPKTLYVDKSGNLIEDNSESNEDSAVSIESAYNEKIGEYSSEPYTKHLEFDMNNDGVPELIIDHGTSEANRKITFYTFKNNKAECIGDNFSGMHCSYYRDNSTDQLCTASVFGGSDAIYVTWYQYDGSSVSVSKQSDDYIRDVNETPEQTLNRAGSFTAL